MKTRSAKAKSRRLQNKLVEQIVATFPELVRGTPEGDTPCDIRPARMGEPGMDVKLVSARGFQVFPFATEAKNRESVNIWKAIEQAEGYANNTSGFLPGDLTPLVAIWRNRMKEPYVAIPLSVFLKIYAVYRRLGTQTS